MPCVVILRRYCLLALVVMCLIGIEYAAGKKAKQAPKKTDSSELSTNSKYPPIPNYPIAKSPDGRILNDPEFRSYKDWPPEVLFNVATKMCTENRNQECYVLFSVFHEKYPSVVEGFTNAGVALEQLQRTPEALMLYYHAFGRFPKNLKAKASLLSVLQVQAMRLYESKSWNECLKIYYEIVKVAPDLVDAHLNLGNILETMQQYEEAYATYLKALELDGRNNKVLNAICRFLLMEVSGESSGRFYVTASARTKAFSNAKRYCSVNVEYNPEDYTANMLMGMLLKDGLDFDSAIIYLRKAHNLEPHDTTVMVNLASLLSRAGQVEEAMDLARTVASKLDHPSNYYSLGDIIGPFDRHSTEGKEGHIKGMKLAVERGKGQPRPNSECKSRTLRYDWLQAQNVTIDIINFPDDEQFGIPHPRMLQYVELDTPLKFSDKETIAVIINDVYLEGFGAIPYTNCEVYATMGINTDLPRYYTGLSATIVKVEQTVVSLLHPLMANYYHMVTETFTRMAVAMDFFFGPSGITPNASLLVPSKSVCPLCWDMFDLFYPDLAVEKIIYNPSSDKSYHFNKLHRIDWVQLDKDDPFQNDLWSDYLPSKFALQALRVKALSYLSTRTHSPKKAGSIIYVGRAGVREVLNQDIMLEDFEDVFGENFFVFNNNNPSTNEYSLRDQLDIFSNAKIIIGAHGAGLTNMLWAPNDVSIVEFPMTPNCDVCYGYMAMALSMDFWVVPEVTTFYHLKYQMTEKKSQATLAVVKEIIKERNLQHLYSRNSQEHTDL